MQSTTSAPGHAVARSQSETQSVADDAPVPPLIRAARPFPAEKIDHDTVLLHLPEIFAFDDSRNVSDAELDELYGRLLSLYDAYQAI